ncbi:MAG: flagellar basal-body MS-ring/collar protein FliF [Ignavibacteriaceae bacterium]
MNSNPLEAVFGIFNKLSLQHKILIGGAILLTVVMLGMLIFFLNEPSYSVLYTNLAEDDASKVVEELNAQKILFKIEDNGKTVKVPKDKLYEIRLNLAGKGIPGSGVLGYEIFDQNTMGMSEFMQKLNFKRALEGELARTIMQQEGIEGVRVHIVTPQKSVFKSEEKEPTASVVLNLKGNYSLSKGSITAILNLVSSSVEGLQPGKVTLLDSKGRLLSNDFEDNPLAFSSTKQYEIKQSVENYLAAKAQSILDNVVGYGNSIIQVNADLNFDQVEKTMEMYDPESQVAISEQTIKSENSGKNLSDSSGAVSENSTTNYEISKTVERVIQGSGNVLRLSVAAVINDVAKEVKNGENVGIVYEPRTPEQLKKLEEIIKNAVGIDPNRLDQFSLVNISFEANNIEGEQIEEPSFFDNIERFTNIILIVIAAIAGLLILKGLMTKLKNEKIIIGTLNQDVSYQPSRVSSGGGNTQIQVKQRKPLLPLGDIEDEISDEAIDKKNREAKIINYVSKNPVEASKLINAWMHEDEL